MTPQVAEMVSASENAVSSVKKEEPCLWCHEEAPAA